MRSAGRLVGAALLVVAALTVSATAQQLGKLPPTLVPTPSAAPAGQLQTSQTPGTLPGLGQPAQRIEPSAPATEFSHQPLPASPAQPGLQTPAGMPPTQQMPLASQPTAPHMPEAIGGVVPGVTRDNPTGRQEPAVSIEWIGPAAAKLGQPADYTVVVRSACNVPLQQVSVRVRLPQGVEIKSTEPKAAQGENVLMWDLGTLMPQQDRHLQVRMIPNAKGDVPCHAWVTFTGSSSMTVRVREPKLLLKTTAPEKALVGDVATFTLTVSNPGDHPAEKVKIQVNLSEGLESSKGNKMEFEIGNLAAGETRSAQVICATRAGGEQRCDATAMADGGLTASDGASVMVSMPRLNLEVVGPKMRYLDRKATYTFKISNPGDAPASNVAIVDVIPAGFKFVSAGEGGRYDFETRSVSWFVGEIAPGEVKEVKLEVLAVNLGEHRHRVAAQASRGLRVENDEMVTKVEGLSAILVEVVDTEDPVEVGSETAYEIRVTNTGSKTETDIRLECQYPVDKLQFRGANGPTQHTVEGNTIRFEPIPRLAPRAEVVYRVNMQMLGMGVAIFNARITTSGIPEGVIKQESTTGYGD